MDRAGKGVDLSVYLPFFKELHAYMKKTSPSQSYSSKSIDDMRKKDPAYAARLKANMDGKFKTAESYIAEAEALLQLTPEARLKLRLPSGAYLQDEGYLLRYDGRFGQGETARLCRGSVCSAFPPEAKRQGN